MKLNYNRFFKTATKVEMVASLNEMFTKFYGCNTKMSGKVERLPKERIAHLAEVQRLWRNDSLADQVRAVEDHIRCEF